MSAHAALVDLLRERSVRFGEFTLASGATSSYYIDCRLTTMSARGQVLIGTLGLDAIRNAGWRPRSVGGLTMGADPVSYAIAAASAVGDQVIDAFSVRKEAKQHGPPRDRGHFDSGDGVVITRPCHLRGRRVALSPRCRRRRTLLGFLAGSDRESGARIDEASGCRSCVGGLSELGWHKGGR